MSVKGWLKSMVPAAIMPVRSLTVREPDGWRVEPTIAGVEVTPRSALTVSAVWACVNLIAGTIASLPVVVYRASGEDQKPAADHPLYRLLHDSPNYDQTALDFWEFLAASLELWGNAFAKIERENGRIVSLTPVNPALVVVRRRQDGRIEYSWSADGKTERLTDESVFHVRGFGGEPLGGMSTLDFARQSLGLALALDRSSSAVMGNGLRPSGVLTFEKWLNPEQRAAAEEGMARKFAGAVNSGRPLVLEGGTKWQSLTINPADAQMLESRRFSVEDVCRFFGVPPHMVGHTEKSTSWGTGIEQQTLAFQKFTLRRRIKRIEQAVMKQLLTPADRAAGIGVEFNLEGLLRADSAGRSRYYQTMTAIGAMTINEVRALESLPAVAGGDVPRLQMQNVPISGIPEGDNVAGVPSNS